MKKENTRIISLNEALTIDGNRIDYIAFDLKHINFGWNTTTRDYNINQRSYITSDDVINFVLHLNYYEFDNEGLNRVEISKKRVRYTFKIWIELDAYRMVIDLKKIDGQVATVVTIFKLRKI